MEKYIDIGHDSGILEFEIIDDGIIIRFRHGGVYEYTVNSAGLRHIQTMQDLARKGDGLNSYINENVKDKYSRKLS